MAQHFIEGLIACSALSPRCRHAAMKKLIQFAPLRKAILPRLQRLNLRDVTIKHHWTEEKLTLHPVKHKAYWFHGKNREVDTMQIFDELISAGDVVWEVGGHIGYITQYFAHLVGSRGSVDVLEPGSNNLPYLERNAARYPVTTVHPMAATNHTGSVTFYVENLSGQNNSLLADYRVLDSNMASHGITAERQKVDVPCTTLDDFVDAASAGWPGFVKIDVEGAEAEVLAGMPKLLAQPGLALMVEVTHHETQVFDVLTSAGYSLFASDKNVIAGPGAMQGNVFCLKPNDSRMRFFS